MIAGSAVPCSIHPAAQAQRRAGEVLAEARRPCELRRGLEGAAAVIEIAGLGAGRAEPEEQLAAGSVVRGLRELEGLEGALEMADGLLVGQCGQRPAGRPGRVVDGPRRRSGLGRRDKW